MKTAFSFLVALSCSFFALAQEDQKPLDGKNYNIEMYEGKTRDSPQKLSFVEGKMIFSDAERYGFSSEEYKCKQKNDSTWTFLSVSKSKKNGTMTWEGKVVNEKIDGTCIWTRPVENPINYTFKGGELKQ